MGSAAAAPRAVLGAAVAACLIVGSRSQPGGGAGVGSGAPAQAPDERKISVVTALLPPAGAGDRTARLRVEAFGGCFEFESTRPSLVRVEAPEILARQREQLDCLERKALECMDRGPVLHQELFGAAEEEPDEAEAYCQHAAVLRSVAPAGTMSKVLVTARPLGSPGVPSLQSEVYVAPVERVEVETRVRRIHVNDSQVLTARAYDAQGNVFSSLEGLEFLWSVSDQAVLRTPALVDTVFKLSPARRALAQAGAQSDMLLLKGGMTGRVTVSVKLLGMSDVPLQSPDVVLTVAESILARPSAVRLPRMAHLQMRLYKPFSEVPEEPLPAVHFVWRWSPSDASPADALFVQRDTAHVVAQRVGSGEVIVEDTRIENNGDAAQVEVVEPSELRLGVEPIGDGPGLEQRWQERRQGYIDDWAEPRPSDGPTWYLVQGRTYVLRLDMLDVTAQGGVGRLYVPENFRAVARCTSGGDAGACPLHVIDQSQSSALVLARAEVLGRGSYHVAEAQVLADDADRARGFDTVRWPALSVRQEFLVVAPLRLLSGLPGPMLLPPWHSHTLQVGGGSGSYVFSLRDVRPVGCLSVSEGGVVQADGQIGEATLLVADARSASNSLTLKVFVRRVEGLVLRPPYLQLQLSEGAADSVPVPIYARPEASGAEGADASWQRLRFWNCSALSNNFLEDLGFGPDAMAVASSDPSVATAHLAPGAAPDDPGATGVCGTASVTPLSVGRFTLDASVRRPSSGPGSILGAGAGSHLRASASMRVYAPLAASFEADAGGAASGSSPSRVEIGVSPCSSATLRLRGGPGPLEVPGRVFQNLSDPLEGTHVALRKLGDGEFAVLCFQEAPGAIRLVAEVRQVPDDPEAHGGPVVARAYAWIRCATPAAAKVALMPSTPAATAVNDSGKNICRGMTHRFRVDFYDAGGAYIANASEYALGWSLEGDSQAPLWLQATETTAEVTLPPDTPMGKEVLLRVLASKPDAARCVRGRGLDSQQEASQRAWVADLARPLSGQLLLRAAPDLQVTWPGYPSKHFPFVPEWAFGFVASHGSGGASLALRCGPDAAEIVDPDRFCDGAANGSLASCVMPACVAGVPGDARSWFIRPVVPGQVRAVFADPDLLGAEPEVLDLSFLPVGRIVLQLSDASGRMDAPMVVRGQSYRLSVQIQDTSGEALPPSTWRPLQLRVAANDSRLEVSARGGLEVVPCGEHLDGGADSFDLVGTAPGIFDVGALVRNRAGGVPVYSNTLVVHVFEPFGIAPVHTVLIPGQTFEFAVNGGPAAALAQGVRVVFSSSTAAVATVGESSGLLTARRPGRATVVARLLEAETGRELFRPVEAEVVVALPDSVSVHQLEVGQPAGAAERGPLVAVPGAREPLRLGARLQAGDMEFTLPLLLAPKGAAEELRDASHACRFQWTTAAGKGLAGGAPAVTLTAMATGAAVVVVAREDAGEELLGGSAPGDVTVSVEVSCPGSRALRASAAVRVARTLGLVSPLPAPCSQGVAPLGVPLYGRLRLEFSAPREHLFLALTGPADEAGAAAGLVDDGLGSLELVAGAGAGEALVSATDLRGWAPGPPLLVPVVVRAPVAARLAPRPPQRLVLGATAQSLVMLAGNGTSPALLSVPANFNVSAASSHPSVLAAEVQAVASGPVLRLRGGQPGCASVSVAVDALVGGGQTAHFADTAHVCVVEGVVARRGPVLAWPSARLQLPAEDAALGPDGEGWIGICIRLACVPGTDASASLPELGGARAAAELAALLRLPQGAVRAAGARWAPPHEPAPSGCAAAGLDVDLELLAEALPPLESLEQLLHSLWYPASPDLLGEALRLLDRSRGVRGALGAAACPPCDSCCTSPSVLCGGRGGGAWGSSAAGVLEVSGAAEGAPVAKALRPGRAAARLCRRGVSAEVDVVVEPVAELRLEAPLGDALLPVRRGDGGVVLSNRPGAVLVLPLRLIAGVAGALAGELRSGPFHDQGLGFQCQPEDVALRDFFDFWPWSAANATLGAGSAASLEAARLLLPQMARGGPQVACVLSPRRPDLRRWSARLSPGAVEVQALVATHEAGSAFASERWAFVPQFEVECPAGGNATDGVCAVLSKRQRAATIWVWTGGHPVEGSVAAPLQDTRRGSVAMRVVSDPQAGSEAPAAVSFRLAWDSPHEWGGVQDVQLRLESRASGQVQLLRVRVDGLGGEAAATSTLPPEFQAPGRLGWAAFLAGPSALALLWCCCCRCARWGSRRAPVDDGPEQLWAHAGAPVLGAGFAGAGELPPMAGGHPFGASPFRPVAAG